MSDDQDPTPDSSFSFHDTCNSLSEPIGNAAGELYGYGTYAAAAETGPLAGPPLAYAIDKFGIDDTVAEHVGGFVTQGWHDVCGIAEDTGSFFGETFHGLTDSLSHIKEDLSSAGGALHEPSFFEPSPSTEQIDPVEPGTVDEPVATGSWWTDDDKIADPP
jgi:hypothetical protein